MPRKIKSVTITEEGRDKGKVFVLEEMPASKAEKWAWRAFLALAKSGIDIGDTQGAGMAGIAVLGLRALNNLNYVEVEPLLDEIMTCVKIQPNPRDGSIVRPLIEDDIEEVATRLKLRTEVFELHTGFSMAAALSNLNSGKAPAASPSTPISQGSSAS